MSSDRDINQKAINIAFIWARGRWKSYQRGLNRNIQPTQKGEVGRERLDLFRGLKKAESSAAVQLRLGKIGFNYFLSRIKVPGVLGLEY